MAGHYYNGRELELLIPASCLEVLKTAVIFGADAVYIGGEAFGLRAKAKNFSKQDMIDGIKFAHEHDVKVYVTANILAHNYDLDGAREYFKELDVIKPDGENIQVTVRRITDDKGKDMESCPHPKQQLYIDLGVKLDRYDILRRKED